MRSQKRVEMGSEVRGRKLGGGKQKGKRENKKKVRRQGREVKRKRAVRR
jgi:hypothetical protein